MQHKVVQALRLAAGRGSASVVRELVAVSFSMGRKKRFCKEQLLGKKVISVCKVG